MIRSMTGFGKAEVSIGKNRFKIEINSVNSRFREVSVRLPKMFSDYEGQLREVVSEEVARGKIFVVVSHIDSTVPPDMLVLNEDIAETYYRMFLHLKKKFKLGGELEISHFVGLPDLFGISPSAVASKAEVDKLLAGLRRALQGLNRMRQREGKALAADMTKRVQTISRAIDRVTKFQPKSLQRYRSRLERNIKEIGGQAVMARGRMDETSLRIDMEVTLMADRADVTEECVRLKSHCQAFSGALHTRGDAGKKLGFILQEMNREANTIGSKAILYDISVEVIAFKEEIEKLREQVQNIE